MVRGGNPGNGFTIVESMIFLAVTGTLMLVAFLMINGKQAQAQFATGVRDFNSKIEDIINDISTG
ncbi:hypothetical protein HY218_00480, partial [Candidatus Saccharibacteria bacterium]|nr:hypothetical protein [Candidatus Saccharibacteria bacterium]